ncbi:MAG: PRC-barrel domain-containing protein [Desertifilum sp.]|nr:PRC-barrel domain-containing protein [Desertifilum sp.]
MLKGGDLIGKPAIAYDTGEQFDRIQDLIFDPVKNQLIGFLIDEGGWFSDARILPFHSIQAIGKDAAIARSKSLAIAASQIPEIDRILKTNQILRGTQMMTTDGSYLGVLVDFFFNEHSGEIEGYEVSGGLFDDLASGRSFVPALQTLKLGEDVAFVPPETLEYMAESHKPVPATSPSPATTPFPDSLHTLENTLGRRVRHSVRSDNGLFIAVPGQIITPRAIERARTHGKERELLAAVGLSSPEPPVIANQSDRLYQKAVQARTQASNLWDKLVDTVTDWQEQNLQARQQKRIKAAVGRPVARAILDRSDRVILNVGELVTHQAIAQAHQEGILDILLDSVDESTAQIAPQEFRAPQTGEAALEQSPPESNPLPPLATFPQPSISEAPERDRPPIQETRSEKGHHP